MTTPKKPTPTQLRGLAQANAARRAKAQAKARAASEAGRTIPQRQEALAKAAAKLAG